MSERASDLAKRVGGFNQEVTDFVEGCSEMDWKTLARAEDWPVGVVARHIAAGHYGAAVLAKMIVAGQDMPQLTERQIVDMGNEHAREHAGCTRAEVLELLRTEGAKLVELLSSWSDADLDRCARFDLLGGDVSAEKFVEAVVLMSGQDHLKSIREAVKR